MRVDREDLKEKKQVNERLDRDQRGGKGRDEKIGNCDRGATEKIERKREEKRINREEEESVKAVELSQ